MHNETVDISDRLSILREATENLRRIRREFVDDPDLLSLYEPSARFLVKSILKEITNDFSHVFSSMAEVDTDVWVQLEGEGLADGRAPIGLVGRFLQRLAVANQHAVSLIEEVQHTGGRFQRRIEDLAQFELAAVASGSVRLGLKGLDLERFLDDDLVSQQPLELPSEDTTGDAENHLSTAIEAARRSAAGIKLLARALRVAENHEELDQLEHDVRGRRNLLKLFHYAQSLTPSTRSQMRSVGIFGSAINVPETHPVVATTITRARMVETVKRLQEHHRFVEGIGFVRAVDLDRKIVMVRPFVSDDGHFEEMECRFTDRTSEEEIGALVDKGVSISGLIIFSATNVPRYLEVDSHEQIGPQQG